MLTSSKWEYREAVVSILNMSQTRNHSFSKTIFTLFNANLW